MLAKPEPIDARNPKAPNGHSELDQIDLRLLAALQRNARSTYAELGALVGLKPPAVHDRVKRLESRGFVLRYAAQLDARRVGYALTAFVSAFSAHDPPRRLPPPDQAASGRRAHAHDDRTLDAVRARRPRRRRARMTHTLDD